MEDVIALELGGDDDCVYYMWCLFLSELPGMFQYLDTSMKSVLSNASAAGVSHSQTRPHIPSPLLSSPRSTAVVDTSSCSAAVMSAPPSAAVVDGPPAVQAGQSSSLDASQMVSAVHQLLQLSLC